MEAPAESSIASTSRNLPRNVHRQQPASTPSLQPGREVPRHVSTVTLRTCRWLTVSLETWVCVHTGCMFRSTQNEERDRLPGKVPAERGQVNEVFSQTTEWQTDKTERRRGGGGASHLRVCQVYCTVQTEKAPWPTSHSRTRQLCLSLQHSYKETHKYKQSLGNTSVAKLVSVRPVDFSLFHKRPKGNAALGSAQTHRHFRGDKQRQRYPNTYWQPFKFKLVERESKRWRGDKQLPRGRRDEDVLMTKLSNTKSEVLFLP